MKNYIFILLATLALSTTACESWLDTTAKSEIKEGDHFKTEAGFQQALTGCYIGMTQEALYGKDMSWCAMELLAHQFNPVIAGSTSDRFFDQFEFKSARLTSRLEQIWSQAYNVIVNANNALKWIDINKEVLDPINYSVIKGELLAIRAYMHFDLMRTYGYGNWAARRAEIDAKYAVPYVTTVSKEMTPQLPTREFFKLLTQDLIESAKLLEQDPITGKHEWSYYKEVNSEGFYDYRNLRLNYYAVKALQARVYLWEGSAESKQLALTAAEEVIEKFFERNNTMGMMNVFRWESADDFKAYPALCLEHLFGLNVTDVETRTERYIKLSFEDADNDVMFVVEPEALEIYENSETDVRLTKLMSENRATSMITYVPLKLYQTGATALYNDRIPMIRISEMYYIAAECYATGATPNLQLALDRLNVVRQKRGLYEPLENLDAPAIQAEIAKEYRKEFFSEGVMFFYYKRTGASAIPHYDSQMSDKEFVLPYPEFETQSGRQQ